MPDVFWKVIAIRPIPYYGSIVNPGNWAADKHCRVLAGWYCSDGSACPDVCVDEQVATILGWNFFDWEVIDGFARPSAAPRSGEGRPGIQSITSRGKRP